MTHQFNVTQTKPGVYHFKCPECGRHMIQDHTDAVNMIRTIVDPGDNSVGHSGSVGLKFSVGVEVSQEEDVELPDWLEDAIDGLEL